MTRDTIEVTLGDIEIEEIVWVDLTEWDDVPTFPGAATHNRKTIEVSLAQLCGEAPEPLQASLAAFFALAGAPVAPTDEDLWAANGYR